MRGRKPVPTALKLLRGNPGKRGPNTAEPLPAEVANLDPPSLRATAERIWRELAPELHRLQLLRLLDPRRLHRACRLEAMGLRYLALAERGPMVGDKVKGQKPAPALHAAAKCFEAADQVWCDFGIGSPSERARLQAPAPKSLDDSKIEDPYDAFRATQRSLRTPPPG